MLGLQGIPAGHQQGEQTAWNLGPQERAGQAGGSSLVFHPRKQIWSDTEVRCTTLPFCYAYFISGLIKHTLSVGMLP